MSSSVTDATHPTARAVAAPGVARSYGLAWNPRPALLWRYVGLAVALAVASVFISYSAVLTLPVRGPVSALYFASAFYALATYWFGGWGLVSAFVGSLIGAGVMCGLPVGIAAPLSIANVLEPLVPFLLLRTIGGTIGLNPLATNILSTPGRSLFFFVAGAVVPPIVSGLWGVTTLRVAGLVPDDQFWQALVSWWIGACILLTIAVPLVGTLAGPALDRTGVCCRGIWS